MDGTPNPFTPDFGQDPPTLVGRVEQLAGAAAALAAGPRQREFTTLMLGPRGVGKTTLLARIEDDAASAGWRVVSVDAPFSPRPGAGVVVDIAANCYEHLEEIAPSRRRRLTGAGAAGLSLSWENAAGREPSFHKVVETLVDEATNEGAAGVLLTVDEFHNTTESDASLLANAIQRIAKRRHKYLAFIGVGLPHLVYTLLPSKGFTFFQRCHRTPLGNVSLHDAMHALASPLREHGSCISEPSLRRAAAATSGHGYSVQSVGHHLWEASGGPASTVTADHVTVAVQRMQHDVATNITTPVWSRLSYHDKRFLFAMLPDGRSSRQRDIAQRLDAKPGHVSTYKKRLLSEGVIEERPDGLRFANAAVRGRAIEEHETLEAESRTAGLAMPRSVHVPPALQAWVQCGVWMPRSEAACVLRDGHRGAHRSRKPRYQPPC